MSTIPVQVDTLNEEELLVADWVRTAEGDKNIHLISGVETLCLDPAYLEMQCVFMDRTEANVKSPQQREHMKRRRAGLVLDLNLHKRSPVELEQAADNCRYKVQALTTATDDAGQPVLVLDLDLFKSLIKTHMQEEYAAQQLGDTDEATAEHECVDALVCLTGSCGVSANLAKWWKEVVTPA